MSTSGPYGQPPQRSGGSNVLMILLVIAGVVLLACAGVCGGCLFIGQRAAKEMEKGAGEFANTLQLTPAYAAAQNAVSSDPQVAGRLGGPITTTSTPQRQGSGNLKATGETFQFDIQGPKGTGIVSGIATADGTNWRATKITVTFSDGSVVDVPAPDDAPHDHDHGDIKVEPE